MIIHLFFLVDDEPDHVEMLRRAEVLANRMGALVQVEAIRYTPRSRRMKRENVSPPTEKRDTRGPDETHIPL